MVIEILGQINRLDDTAEQPATAGRRPAFGRRGTDKGEVRHGPPSFGRRVNLPELSPSLQRERLRGLYGQLWMVFSDPAFPQNAMPIRLDQGDTPAIRIEAGATITVDGHGAFVFEAGDGRGRADTITTTDADRLMDFVVAHLTQLDSAPQSGFAQLTRSVGRSLQDVERGLILSTLRHCQGNRSRAADMLGISLRTLRSKLQSYWAGLVSDGQATPVLSVAAHGSKSQ